ncbi:uncharacterized protein LOC110066537 isoform X2 [Orbicella faveolata]|uniref:uncharacterized protein LOC110066537 isoform X2 n=1 Tax=Orbicella faveolata TaxID=48498 RepID=UPI0009E3B415|nr:uncharacterized protein LOC110066537 isoform X2 [Orbicella faveolata]
MLVYGDAGALVLFPLAGTFIAILVYGGLETKYKIFKQREEDRNRDEQKLLRRLKDNGKQEELFKRARVCSQPQSD